jgi:hypothetical protein
LLTNAAHAVSFVYKPPGPGGTGYAGNHVRFVGVHIIRSTHSDSLLTAVCGPHCPLAVNETTLAPSLTAHCCTVSASSSSSMSSAGGSEAAS